MDYATNHWSIQSCFNNDHPMASNHGHFGRPPTFRNPFGMMMAFHWILPPNRSFFSPREKKTCKNAGTGRKTRLGFLLGWMGTFQRPPFAGKNFGWMKNLPTKKDLRLEKIVVFLRLGMGFLDLFTETLGYSNSPKKKSAILGNKLASYEGGLESQSFRGMKILKKKMPIPNSVASFPPTRFF